MRLKYKLLFFLGAVFITVASCKKYLDKKPNSNVQVPTTPAEFQGLLDNPLVFSYGHTFGMVSSDEFSFSPFYYISISTAEQNAYTWQRDIFSSTEIPFDWSKAYEAIYNSNVVLEGLAPLMANIKNDKDLNKLKSDALFKRALGHFLLAHLFAPAYEDATATRDLGIPLKLTTDLEEPVTRPVLKACFDRILSDLDEAKGIAPDSLDPAHRNRASKAAVLALLARVHLYMGNWEKAATDAEQTLGYYYQLVDFNLLDTNLNKPFKSDNREVMYYLKAPDSDGQNALVVGLSDTIGNASVDTGLIRSYAPQDLRLPIYFRQRGDKTWTLKFTLSGTRTPFEGVCVSEVMLTLAEARARLGNGGAALAALESLLVNRYKKGQIVPALPSAADANAVLDRILAERQKELAFKGLRWMDIKRLNKQNRRITQYRLMNNQLDSIGPNDLRYALPLPKPTIEKYGIHQNDR